MLHRHVALIALSLILAIPACGGESSKDARQEDQRTAEKIAEEAIRKAGGGEVKVDLEGDTVRFSSEQGDLTVSSGSGASLPEGFPDDIPIYDDAELLTSAHSQQEEAFNATWTTDEEASKVKNFITGEMQKKGWQSETTLNTPRQTILAYTKDDRGASFIIATNEEKTTISMTTGKE